MSDSLFEVTLVSMRSAEPYFVFLLNSFEYESSIKAPIEPKSSVSTSILAVPSPLSVTAWVGRRKFLVADQLLNVSVESILRTL